MMYEECFFWKIMYEECFFWKIMYEECFLWKIINFIYDVHRWKQDIFD